MQLATVGLYPSRSSCLNMHLCWLGTSIREDFLPLSLGPWLQVNQVIAREHAHADTLDWHNASWDAHLPHFLHQWNLKCSNNSSKIQMSYYIFKLIFSYESLSRLLNMNSQLQTPIYLTSHIFSFPTLKRELVHTLWKHSKAGFTPYIFFSDCF